MTAAGRVIVWFNRLVLAGAMFVMTMIALRTLADPIGSTQPLGITLQSATAVTIVRVGLGGFPLGFAMALFACLLTTRRTLTGLVLVLAFVGGVAISRVQGLVLDGATAYNLNLLRPEIAMIALSSVGIVLERQRQRASRWSGASSEPPLPG